MPLRCRARGQGGRARNYGSTSYRRRIANGRGTAEFFEKYKLPKQAQEEAKNLLDAIGEKGISEAERVVRERRYFEKVVEVLKLDKALAPERGQDVSTLPLLNELRGEKRE